MKYETQDYDFNKSDDLLRVLFSIMEYFQIMSGNQKSFLWPIKAG
jgi:hypothetical protein